MVAMHSETFPLFRPTIGLGARELDAGTKPRQTPKQSTTDDSISGLAPVSVGRAFAYGSRRRARGRNILY